MALSKKQLRERDRLTMHYQPNARDWFELLRERLYESRPVIGRRLGGYKVDENGAKRYTGDSTPIVGAPTFRNRINEAGEHV